VPDASAAPAAFADAVAALAARLGADVLLPVTEASLLAILPRRDEMGVAIPFAPGERFSAISDKVRVLEEALRLGIAVPLAIQLDARDAMEDALAGMLHYPLVLKPGRSVRAGAAGATKHDVRHVPDRDTLRRLLRDLPDSAFPALLQERVVGPGTGVFLLRWEGRTVARFAHRRLREKPPAGGVSVYSESVPLDDELLALSEALLERFDWRGVAMVEYKLDAATGTPYLMEVNGRFWGSLQLAIAAGVDFPALLVRLARGEHVEPVTDYRVGVRNRWWWGDVDQLLTRLRRSRRRLSLPRGAPGRLAALGEFAAATLRPGGNEVLDPRDPRPFLRETLDWVRGR
jgi:predicted ATP-grasp superfamily ATP-dependent carboligase